MPLPRQSGIIYSSMELEHGTPLREYRLIHFLSAVPLGVLLKLYIGFCRITSNIEISGDNQRLEKGTMVFLVHKDYYPSLVPTQEMKHLLGPGFIWLGYHGFYSYVPFLWFWRGNIRVFRYQTRGTGRPFDAIKQLLENNPLVCYCQYTDSGGPYGRVRESLAKLSLTLARPVRAIRVTSSNSFSFLNHQVPLPFSTVSLRISQPVHPDNTDIASVSSLRDKLQILIDGIQ